MPGTKATAANARSCIKERTGRPKGSKDKFTNLKHAFLKAFEDTGGTEGLTKWADQKVNKGDFYKMIARMLPTNVRH